MVELDDPRVRYQYENHTKWLTPAFRRKAIQKFQQGYLNFVVPSEAHLDSFTISLRGASKWLHIPLHMLLEMIEEQGLRERQDFIVHDQDVWLNSRALSQILQMLPWDHPIGRAARQYFATMDFAYRSFVGETLRRRNRLEREMDMKEDNLEEPEEVNEEPGSAFWTVDIKGLDGTDYTTMGISSDLNTTMQRLRLTQNELVALLPKDGAKAWKEIQKRNGWTDEDHPRPRARQNLKAQERQIYFAGADKKRTKRNKK